jgi:hypothetical protein
VVPGGACGPGRGGGDVRLAAFRRPCRGGYSFVTWSGGSRHQTARDMLPMLMRKNNPCRAQQARARNSAMCEHSACPVPAGITA